MSKTIRKSTLLRREEIALAVLKIVGERGVSDLTTTNLAKEVGITSGALFRHFVSRDEMLLAAADLALDRIEATFPDVSLPPLERLMALADNRLRVVGSDPGVAWVIRSEEACLELPAAAVAKLRDLIDRTKNFLIDALREGAASGAIRRDIAPDVLFVPVIGTIHALIGMTGAHDTAGRAVVGTPDRVLPALAVLLAPTANDAEQTG